ncbi:MAG: hypothetical protein WKG07_33655 [Hymenobacter sp.]
MSYVLALGLFTHGVAERPAGLRGGDAGLAPAPTRCWPTGSISCAAAWASRPLRGSTASLAGARCCCWPSLLISFVVFFFNVTSINLGSFRRLAEAEDDADEDAELEAELAAEAKPPARARVPRRLTLKARRATAATAASTAAAGWLPAALKLCRPRPANSSADEPTPSASSRRWSLSPPRGAPALGR